MKQEPILTRFQWVERCAARLESLDRQSSRAYCHDLAGRLWDRGECQVMGPAEAAEFLFDDRLHSGFRDFEASTLRSPLKGVR